MLHIATWPGGHFQVFPQYPTNVTTFGEKLFNMTLGGFDFLVLILTETFLILNITERVMTIGIYWASSEVPVIGHQVKYQSLGIK